MASNTCFAGLVEYLRGKEGVKDVQVRPGRPASVADILSWEKSSNCTLPEDVKLFYTTHNGLDLHWSYLYSGNILPLGGIHVASLSELRPLVTTPSHTHSNNEPSLWDLEPESGSDVTGGRWEPSLCSGTDCSVYVLNYCSTCGHTCLVFRSDPNSHGSSDADCSQPGDCTVWLLDLGLSWHHLSHTFSDYLRLAIVHLGLRQWPYAVTANKLSPEYEYWFHIFAPHRLEIDATQNHSTSSVDWTETGHTEGDVLNVVDVSKILHCRLPRDRRVKSSKSANKQHSATRRSSTNKSS